MTDIRTVERISTGSSDIDECIGGGIERGVISVMFGEGGSGKTNLCLQLARNAVQAGGKVLFIDTENVSIERFAQICGDDFERFLPEVLFFHAETMEEQNHMVTQSVRLARTEQRFDLLVIDSITALYRLGFGSETEAMDKARLMEQLTELAKVARASNIPVVATTQVYTSQRTDTFEPIGGHVMTHSAKAIYRLGKLDTGLRTLEVVKHRSLPEGRNCQFMLTGAGVE